MAYVMAWRLRIRVVGVTGEAQVDDADLFDIPEYAAVGNDWNADAGLANSFGGERVAGTTGITLTRILQSLLKRNLRFEVWGKPVGTPEAGAPDLTNDQKTEELYISGDTPNLALVIAIRKANKTPESSGGAAGRPAFVPADPNPEVLYVAVP